MEDRLLVRSLRGGASQVGRSDGWPPRSSASHRGRGRTESRLQAGSPSTALPCARRERSSARRDPDTTSRRRSPERGVTEGEHPAVAGHHPVAAGIGRHGHPRHRGHERDATEHRRTWRGTRRRRRPRRPASNRPCCSRPSPLPAYSEGSRPWNPRSPRRRTRR